MAAQLPLDLDPPVPSDEGRLVLAPHGPAARSALFAAVAAAQGGDPLAPVTVAVPSPLAGLGLRRALGASSGLVNVHFTALARVAELLGAPRLAAAGRRPLAGPLRAEAVHKVLLADPGPLDAVAGHPSTTQHLAATFTELARVPATALATIAARGPRAATVVRLFEAYRAEISGYYDEDDLVLAATAAITDGTAPADEVGHVIVHLPLDLSPSETTLLGALAEQGRCTVLLGLTGDPAVDAAQADMLAARLAPALGAAVRVGTAPAAPTADLIVSAPDPEDEVRAVVRRLVARAAAGEPLGRVAVLFRAPEPYARILPELLTAAHVPWNGPSPRRIADGVAGRVLLGLLALPDDDLARDDVAAWLASGPVRDPAVNHRVNAARWDALSRQAGVVRGADQWADRLAAFRDAIERRLAQLLAEGEDTEWQTRRLERDRDDAAALAAFAADLAARLTPPDPPTWSALAAWARDLHDHFLGSEGHRGDWPEHELTATRRVEEALAELGGLDAFDDHAELARFRRALAAELDAPIGRIGRFGGGVLIGQLGQAYAGDLDVVYVLGGAEGTLPPRGREDPLLPDRDRRDVPSLTLHADRRNEERRDYLAALVAARERVLTFPRADPRASANVSPHAGWSSLHARSAPQRRRPRSCATTSTSPGSRSCSPSTSSPRRANPAPTRSTGCTASTTGTPRDHDLAEHPLAAGALARGFVATAGRSSADATAFDGFVGARADLAPGQDRPTSPTALQEWAACPFRYFLSRVLRLRAVPRPEDTETISPLDRGSLVHAILEDFVRESPAPEAPDAPWTGDDEQRMLEIVERHCAEAEARGITGRDVNWVLEKRRIEQHAMRFLDTDLAARTRFGVVPAADGLERAFGDDGEPPVQVALGDGRTVTFRGRIDRVDHSPDGRLVVVYDYKTGSSGYEEVGADPVNEGRSLQLPVYALAALQRDGAESARAHYWFTGEEWPDALGVHVDLDGARDRFVDVVGTIVDGVEGGCFPANPGERSYEWRAQRETYESCRHCDFDVLCPVDRGTVWERKSEGPAYAPFHDLANDAADEEEAAP